MAQTSGFNPTTQVKTCFDRKMFDVINWVACLNGENGPWGMPSHKTLQFHLKEHWRYPQSLDSLLSRTEAISAHLVAESHKRDERCRPSSQRPQYPTLFRRLKQRLGLSEQASTKGLWSDREKRATHKSSRAEAGFSGPSKVHRPVSKQNSVGSTDNSSIVHKQGGTHSAEMCALLWKIMTWCHHYQITLKARHILGCLNLMADLLSRSNHVQSTEWSLHPQVFKQICEKWFTLHVDLFATHLNHKVPLYVSPVPDQNARDKDALNINWLGLTAYAYPPTALLHRVIQKNQAIQLPDHCNALVLGPSAALNRDPTSTTSVNNSSQTFPQLCVS